MKKKIDVDKPVENPQLIKYFSQLKNNKIHENLSLVLNEIMERSLFLSVIILSEEPKPQTDGSAVFTKDTIVQFPMLTSSDEKRFYPVFTDWQELSKWKVIKSPKTLILSFDDYAAMVLDNETVEGIVINPFGDNFLMDSSLIKKLRSREHM